MTIEKNLLLREFLLKWKQGNENCHRQINSLDRLKIIIVMISMRDGEEVKDRKLPEVKKELFLKQALAYQKLVRTASYWKRPRDQT